MLPAVNGRLGSIPSPIFQQTEKRSDGREEHPTAYCLGDSREVIQMRGGRVARKGKCAGWPSRGCLHFLGFWGRVPRSATDAVPYGDDTPTPDVQRVLPLTVRFRQHVFAH